MARTPEEVFTDHVALVNRGELSPVLDDYAEDAVLLTAQGPLKGHAGVEAFFTQAFTMFPSAVVTIKSTVWDGDALLVWWDVDSPGGKVDDGVDTILISDGLIKLQTTSFTPQLNG